ncbi:MAG: hypothetical protein HC906_08740 [Bacteroidales bacterium]|nr:hypothetical protein [Bacteroidales bacterium]
MSAINVVASKSVLFNLAIENSSFSFREGAAYSDSIIFEGARVQSPALFNLTNFNKVQLKDVVFEKQGSSPVMKCSSGTELILDEVDFVCGGNKEPLVVESVKKISKEKVRVE